MRSVVSGCDAPPDAAFDEAVASLRHWRERLHGHDIARPGYYQSTAAGVGLLVAAPDAMDPRERFARINAVIGNFWDCCDDLVHAAGGFTTTPLRRLTTTLRGVEDLWFDREAEALSGGAEPYEVLESGLRAIEGKAGAREEAARAVARCAGWLG
ncbi:hypothetical protein [Nonomuraea jiangxiensis]|uniref:Uncharacterized protein n=1 Tax=Nonomuraea jiangxiensis TaxID=633440 RepID=A0A1G8QH42_9ACTN|nr:hypothetical protein [Nonomuraea jiangxiensis]SDJ04092.1 hypothetical protein SAMN05421869_108247 [Nonomuraea jiangxiensis]